MGRLSGFSYREVVRRFRTFGFQFDRQGPGSHEIWRHSQTGRKVTIPHHTGDLAEGTLRAILREAGIEVQSFLKASPAPRELSVAPPTLPLLTSCRLNDRWSHRC